MDHRAPMKDDATTRIMLVDDEANVLSALERLLRSELRIDGRRVVYDTFTSPQAALAAAGAEPYELVLSDFRMPGLDGVEMLRRMRDIQPDMARVIMSGSRDFEFLLRAINQAGVSRVILKPWFNAELIATLVQGLEHRRLLLENRRLADEVRVQRGLISQHEAELRRLEERWPGITRVQTAPDGGVYLFEPGDPDAPEDCKVTLVDVPRPRL